MLSAYQFFAMVFFAVAMAELILATIYVGAIVLDRFTHHYTESQHGLVVDKALRSLALFFIFAIAWASLAYLSGSIP